MKKPVSTQKQLFELFKKELLKDQKKNQKEIFSEFERLSKTKRQPKKKTSPKKSKRPTRNKPRRTWVEKRKRTKVKTFPNKHDKSQFFYSTKKQFILVKPVKIDDEQDLELLESKIIPLIPRIYDFFLNELKYKRAKSRLMNIGYQIVLQFGEDMDNRNTIITTSFLPTLRVVNKKSIEQAVRLIIDHMFTRFEEYLNTRSFYSLEFYGLEAEIEP